MKAENETAIERLGKELAQRDKADLQWMMGIAIALAGGITGILIKLFSG